MEKFTASNGMSVDDTDDAIYFDGRGRILMSSDEMKALREFFRAKEDDRLGRWRWPENPDFIGYPAGTDTLLGAPVVRLIRESDGATSKWLKPIVSEPVGDPEFDAAARAYFAAHPEPKPWHDAKPGEVWALRTGGDEHPYRVVKSIKVTSPLAFLPLDPDVADLTIAMGTTAPAITAGRRLWPESS